jgi:hypothetical protein
MQGVSKETMQWNETVMCGKKLISIWLTFRILGLEMNFDNIICKT